jgi:hypothetical protein
MRQGTWGGVTTCVSEPQRHGAAAALRRVQHRDGDPRHRSDTLTDPCSPVPWALLDERELGRRRIGEAFLARDTRLDRQVAITALPAHLAQDSVRLASFQHEAA